MKPLAITFLLLTGIFIILFQVFNGNPSFRIVIVSDSLASTTWLGSSQAGWGQKLYRKINPDIEVINLSFAGQSSKSFIEQGYWVQALQHKPNMILVSFAWNDLHSSDSKVRVNTKKEFKVNLKRFVYESRQISALPILITPPAISEPSEKNLNTTPSWPAYMKVFQEVSQQMAVDLIDLDQIYQQNLTIWSSSEKAKINVNEKDKLHFSHSGADWVASVVARELKHKFPEPFH